MPFARSKFPAVEARLVSTGLGCRQTCTETQKHWAPGDKERRRFDDEKVQGQAKRKKGKQKTLEDVVLHVVQKYEVQHTLSYTKTMQSRR